MKLMKRATALLICFLMLTNGPISAFATEGVSDNDVVVETTTTTETATSCEECGESDAHTDDCSFNSVTPLTTGTPDETTEPTEPTVGGNDVVCCTECGATEGHTTECSQYEAPVEDIAEIVGPQVGDKIWIKHDSYVYKSQSAENGHKLLLNYEVEIVNIITDENGNAVWYEFAYTTTGIGEWLIREYKYVQVENTSEEEPEPSEPVDENACNCGENAPENIADHADSCPRKQYVKSLFENKTAEEIYAQWDNYDEATQIDLLNMLQKWDNAKYEELKKLVDGTDDSSGLDIVYVQYAGTTSNGVSANITAPEGAFPEGTTVTVKDTTVAVSQVEGVVSGTIKGIVAIDINFGAQPSEAVVVSMDIPESQIPSDANMVQVVHMGSNGPELVSSSYLNTSNPGATVSFVATGFSSYAAVFVNGKYDAQLMSSVLAENRRYSVVPFNVDLFDYDPATINNALNYVTSDNNGFHFTGYGITGMGSNNGINNSASTHAKQGILQNTLSNGLPVFNYLNGENAGVNTGKVLFSDSEYTSGYGKTIYNNIPFEFIYDNQTGYYEYKSSANHAQLNAEKNKIELYADTLAIYNDYVATLDLSTASGLSDFTDTKSSASLFKAVATDNGGVTGRLDPYVVFTVNNVVANTVGQIYVKAKVPASVGANQFQLFFTTDSNTSWTEDKSFLTQYTAKDDWIEFVIDTSSFASRTDKITAVRVDLFDSNKGNLNVSSNYEVEIKEIRFMKAGIADNATNYSYYGGFYPFSEIADSYPGNNTAFDLNRWSQQMLEEGVTLTRSSRSVFNPAPAQASDAYGELAFGTVMEFDFYLPVSKTGLDGNPLTYYFNGDDDLWVFVDDQLVLDIGGGHGAITGSVNFTSGTWNVANAITVEGYNSGADGTYGPKSGQLSDAVYSPGKHTMKIFYLERGGSVSNCYMRFNLPRTPQGSVVVSKEAVEKNNANNDELLATEFDFQISIQNNGTGDNKKEAPLANTDYYIVNSDATTSKGTTDDKGNFKLKSGQIAYFDIDENFNVTVTETMKEITDHKWVSTEINDVKDFTLTQLTVNGEEKSFSFVNTYERLYGDLLIKKDGISELDHNPDETQSTIFAISGISSNGQAVNLEVAIVGNDQKLIKHIPIGQYTVTEKADWSWRYDPTSKKQQVKIVGGQTSTTEFLNERTEIYWLSGDSYCENWWGGDRGNVIRKDDED